MQNALEQLGVPTRPVCVQMDEVCGQVIGAGRTSLEKGRIVIFAAGVGAPYFTTDSDAACVRPRCAAMPC